MTTILQSHATSATASFSTNTATPAALPSARSVDIGEARLLEPAHGSKSETTIRRIKGHRWNGKSLSFEVEWQDDDITWAPFSTFNECIALDNYLRHHGLTEAMALSKKRYSIVNL